VHRRRVGHIRRNGHASRSGGAGARHRGIEQLGASPGEHDAVTVLDERERHGLADARAGTRDDRHFQIVV
jgi:hypothetical protein